MRDIRVDAASGLVAASLCCVALVFALVRSPGHVPAPPPDDWQALGRETYRVECSACHASASALAPTLATDGGSTYVIRLLLRGELRSAEDPSRLVAGGHRSFDHLSNEALAAVINHLSAGQGTVTPKDVEAERRSGR